MSPKSRGRPPGRGRPKSGARKGKAPGSLSRADRELSSPGWLAGVGPSFEPGDDLGDLLAGDWPEADEETDCWFDVPVPGDRRSWAMPSGYGTYRGIELEGLNPSDEDELGILVEAQHAEWGDAIDNDRLVAVGGEMANPRLHVTLHQVVANQLIADEPRETWQTVQRLAGLGYDWHNIMHMIAGVVTENVYDMLAEGKPHDPVGYAQKLSELPGDWPPPEP